MTNSLSEHPILSELARMKASIVAFEELLTSLPDLKLKPVRREVTCEDVLRCVASEWDLNPEQIISHNNCPSVVEPRHAAMYLCTMLTNCSLPVIGRRLGGFHHTSVLNAREKMASLRSVSSWLNSKLGAVERKVSENFTDK